MKFCCPKCNALSFISYYAKILYFVVINLTGTIPKELDEFEAWEDSQEVFTAKCAGCLNVIGEANTLTSLRNKLKKAGVMINDRP